MKDENVQDRKPANGTGSRTLDYQLRAEFAVGVALLGGPDISLALMGVPATENAVTLVSGLGAVLMIRSVAAWRHQARLDHCETELKRRRP